MFNTGLTNYYQAHLTNSSTALSVFCMPIDVLSLTSPVRLVKRALTTAPSELGVRLIRSFAPDITRGERVPEPALRLKW